MDVYKGPVTLHNDNDLVTCNTTIGKKIMLLSTLQRKW